MTYTIREATAKDSLALSRLMTQLLNREITEKIMKDRIDFVARSPFDSLFVYEEDRIMGTLGFRIRENIEDIARYGEISVIVVDTEEKRKGIGGILMKFAECLAIQNECKGTWLVTGHKRINEAHKFYIELGYEDTGVRFVKNF